MTLRKILIIPLIVSVVFFGLYSSSVIADLRELMGDSYNLLVITVGIAIAVTIQFASHWLRAYKMSFLMSPAIRTSSGIQFRALSTGYLFNTILPFRLGELIRAQIIAYGQSISFGFSLTLVIIERLFDLLLLLVAASILAWIGIFPSTIVPYLIGVAILSALILCALLLVIYEYSPVMKLVHKISSLFNENIKVRLRFKYWTVLYGLKQSMTPKRLLYYLLLSSIMWVGYAGSVWALLAVLPQTTSDIAHVVSPFYSMSIPFGPANLGSYSRVYYELTQGQAMALPDKLQMLSTWAFLVIPMGMVGLYNTMRLKVPAWRRLQRSSETGDLVNKLARDGDISYELSLFLDNYLKGNSLSKIVNRLERGKDFKLLRYFKGGSDAITILVNKSGRNVVEKIIARDLKDRLKAQYDWLREYRDKNIVSALREDTAKDYYAIELDYSVDNEMFFEYMHHSSLEESKRVLDETWSALNRTVHKKTERTVNHEAILHYIDTHFYGCLDKALGVSDDLRAVIEPEMITINSKEYMNVYTIMDRIKKSKSIMKDLATYNSSGAVHGDVAIDNILVDRKTGKVTLIDPAPDGNIINGRVFDFSKNMQSLYCGYEFLFRSEEPALLGSDGSIAYRDQKSLRYMQLCDYVRGELAPKYLTKAEQRAILFHAGVLLIRRLKHQVYQDPQLTLSMYAAGVKTLNDFYNQY